MIEVAELWDYRRRVAEMYADLRHTGPNEASWRRWTRARDLLFKEHPQSPIDDREAFAGLTYFDYDPRWQVTGRLITEEPTTWGEFSRIGRLEFDLAGEMRSLPVFWLAAYGGGVFVPFRDLTNGDSTYGGGRYILDTVKGADLGHDGDQVKLDFNFAYHPSCVHSDRWTCPLAPRGSRLDIAVTAGEMLRPDAASASR